MLITVVINYLILDLFLPFAKTEKMLSTIILCFVLYR